MMKTQNNFHRINNIVFIVWTFLLVTFFFFGGNHIKQNIRELALFQARSNFNKDVGLRHWITMHGGLYVPVTQETPRNPYLSHIERRDGVSSDGTPLTLMNPAYAIRQINEMFFEKNIIRSHISSDKPLHPANVPDQWEQNALRRFEQGEKEVYEFTQIDDKPFLRLIQPLVIRKDCLKCHDRQGYNLGDIKGIFGVSLAMAPLYVKQQHNLFWLKSLLLSIWLLGSFLILWGGNTLGRVNRERSDLLQRLETLYQKSADGILLIQDGKVIDCNEAAVNMLGLTEKESLIGSHPADFSPELQFDGRSSHEKAEELLKLCLEQGSSRFEWIHQNSKGEEFWIEVVLTRITLQDEPVIHVSWRDINTLKKSQRELATYQDRLEELLAERTAKLQKTGMFLRKSQEIAHVGSWKLDLQTDELTWSDEVYRIFGVSPDEFIPSFDSVMAAIHPDDREKVQQAYTTATAKQIPYDVIHRIVRPDGSVRHVHEKSEEHIDKNGKHLFSTGMVQDITDQMRVNTQLLEAQQQAEEASKQKSLFLANMSHEIRTPMNALIGLSELALETTLSDQQYDYLSKINSSSHRLLTVLNDILDFSKIEAGKMELIEDRFSLPELIDEVGSLFVHQAAEKGLELRFSIENDIPSHLQGDGSRLRQVLMNLLGNALKFTNQGRVELRVFLLDQTEKTAHLKFSIVDNGIGIPADKLVQLFHAFSQVDASHTRKYGGTGLGLAISREFVEMMGGRLEVKSEEGQGCEFFFLLELKKAEKEERTYRDRDNSPEENRQIAMRQIDGARILLVEDDSINRQVVVEVLSRASLDVVIALNGKEALEQYCLSLEKSNPFTAILMDIQMPVLDGYGATAQIRAIETEQPASDSHLPIIAMTAHTMVGDQEKCLAAGMDDFIAKPVNSSTLFMVLAKWINKETISSINFEIKERPAGMAEQNFSARSSLFEQLPGIDFHEGLARIEGNLEMYLPLLKRFVDENRITIKEIKENVRGEDMENVRRQVHTLKGRAATLGGVALAQAAFDLEVVFEQERDAAAPLYLLEERFEEFIDSIERILPEEESLKEKISPDISVDYQPVTLLIEELKALLFTKHFNATKKWLELKPLLHREKMVFIQEIDGCVGRFEFEQAAKLLTEVEEIHKESGV